MSDAAPGPVARYLLADHVRLEALLRRATAEPGWIEPEDYAEFRRGLLRHIGLEEKLLLPAAQRARDGEPLPLAARLRLDHGALAALLVPTPTPAVVATLRFILAAHNPLEEGPDGAYAECERLLDGEADALLERLRAAPPVPVATHADGERVAAATARALARAGYVLLDVAALAPAGSLSGRPEAADGGYRGGRPPPCGTRVAISRAERPASRKAGGTSPRSHGGPMARRTLAIAISVVVALGAAALLSSRGGGGPVATSEAAPTGNPLDDIIQQRGLTPDEAEAALKTFVPPGKFDEFVMVTSGGHRGTIMLYGIPSMRLLKEVPVYAPDAWQGWQQGETGSMEVVKKGSFGDGLPTQTWGDIHHPQISLTNGKYDGEWIVATDKSAGRVAIISMRDFKTKSIYKIPNATSDHHGVFTDNSEYVIVSTFFPMPFNEANGYAPIEDYKTKYKGTVSFLRFDRKAGRIVPEESFQLELPPYFQDLSIAGRGPSNGYFFINSMNVEMSTGGDMEGKPPMEIGASQREMDYLHVIDWKKAEAVAKDPAKTKMVNGIKVIALPTLVSEKILWFVPESKSPHGVDLVPGGEYVVVSGKLDPHVSVYAFEKIKKAIDAEDFEGKDAFGVPILKYDDVITAHVQVGLGPLHSVFDNQGNGYTSCFLDSTVVKWTLGPPYNPPEKAWQAVDKISVHYNIGHLQAPGSNTKKPWGKYLVALNKWSVDRFPAVGPLHPQNLQLIDISGPKMRLLSDTPTIGEPHNAQMIPVEMMQAWTTYPEAGFDLIKMAKSEFATEQGKESIKREGNTVTVNGTVLRSHYTPDIVRVKQGDKVVFNWTNVETARDATHGFGLHGYNINLSIDPGATERAEFVASRGGVYPYYCTEFCSALHMEFTGWLLVEPKK